VVGRIDLDHHLMPDPVGEAISILLDRVEFLEARLAYVQKRLRDGNAPIRGTDAPHLGPRAVEQACRRLR